MKFLDKNSALPLFAVLGGAGITALALGADLIGIGSGSPGIGPKQTKLAFIGFTLLLIGILLDLIVGKRFTAAWLRQVMGDLPGVGKFLSIAIQLGLIVLVIKQFGLEAPLFHDRIIVLACYGFLINYFLPSRYRLSFFLLLSIVGVFGVFGFPNGAWLIGIGLVLIGICHLPIPFSARIGLLLAAGVFLAALRSGWIETSWSVFVLPILASMFMFRLIVYLYDLRHSNGQSGIRYTLSYFFLLPNLVFPLFPVVDYKTFCRTYYDDDQYKVYQTGVKWMFRGVIHLILYRFVKYYLVIAPETVTSASDLAHYMISNFLLILRLSGQFHMAVGMLHLFGFNLPAPMHRYWLASSFIDFWRRANSYWKDFMQKVFFYPVYFRLRGYKGTTRLLVSVLFVFLVTWFLHAYQWFWFRGSFLLSLSDLLFWIIFAVLVTANALYEDRYGKKRSLGKGPRTLGKTVFLVLRTLGTFSVICILWSLWMSPSLSEWFSLWSGAGVKPEDVAKLIPIFSAIIALALVATIIFERASRTVVRIAETGSRQIRFFRSAAISGVLIFTVYLIGSPVVYSQFDEKARKVIGGLQVARLSAPDAARLERGYYENITDVGRFNSELWEIYMAKPDTWALLQIISRATRATGDFLLQALRPSVVVFFEAASFRTNRWGMRDQDYGKKPPPDTYRIALLGGSRAMGWGVADGETFESILEDRLNREHAGTRYVRYEILNLAGNDYRELHHLFLLEEKVWSFEPDAVFLVGHPRWGWGMAKHLYKRVQEDINIPYDDLKEIVHEAGVDRETKESEALRRLDPFSSEISAWAFHQIMDRCTERGIVPVWICLPVDAGVNATASAADTISRFEEAGFIVLDLCDVYENQKEEYIRLRPWDQHPNAKGHRLIADRLYETLREMGDKIHPDLALTEEK